jgi:hypothetical protein
MTAWRTPRHLPNEEARLRDAIERAQEHLSRTADRALIISIREKIAKLKKRLDECRK